MTNHSVDEDPSGQIDSGLKASQREFHGIWKHAIDFGLALISILVIYWTVYLTSDAVIKRALFLMLTFVLCAIVYPFNKKSPPTRISLVDIVIVIFSIAGSLYVMYEPFARFARLGNLNSLDIFFGSIMILIGLDLGRRVIGWALTVVASATILYAYFGHWIPGTFGTPSFEIADIVSHVYCGMEGYYGMVTKFLVDYVVPFMLLGAFLEKTGAGAFFIKLAFSLTRGTVGGPAKAAVIGSALMGSISGSAIANVSTTGAFTIPMMKSVGFRPHVAGAIEAAASTGGQIMPPIMGAVAFIMVEFTQIPYLTIVKVATIPIILYFITIGVFIHFEAKKYDIRIDKGANIPPAMTIVKSGWHYFLALFIVVLTMALGYSPAMGALGGMVSLVAVHSIQRRRIDLRLIYRTLVLGGKYSLSIGSIAACIGIILALVGLTGIGMKFSWFLADLSHGMSFLAIIFVGLISLILGMGLPAGAAYIVLAIAAGPALIDLGFPLLQAHLIMIWFSIDSEITPPIGLASITAAGIARADAMKTMLTAFKYAKGLYILPFLFYYRPGILLQDSLGMILETIISTLLCLVAFAAFWENYLFRRLNVVERVGLLISSAALAWPSLMWNSIGCVLLGLVIFSQKMTVLKPVRVESQVPFAR